MDGRLFPMARAVSQARVEEIQDFPLVNAKTTKRQINSISEASSGTSLDKRMAAEKGDWTKGPRNGGFSSQTAAPPYSVSQCAVVCAREAPTWRPRKRRWRIRARRFHVGGSEVELSEEAAWPGWLQDAEMIPEIRGR